MATAILQPKATRSKRAVRFNDDGDPILPRGAEFVDGQILEKPVSELSAWVSSELFVALRLHVNQEKLGLIFNGSSEQSFQCFADKPKQIRRPDAAFVRRALTGDFLSKKGYTKAVPELIAEVLSPDDRIIEVNARIRDFRLAGTKLLWVIDPIDRSASIIHADGIAIPIGEDGILSGGTCSPASPCPSRQFCRRNRKQIFDFFSL